MDDLRFCSKQCARKSVRLIAIHEHARTLPAEFIEEQARQVFEGPCPRCGAVGGVDLHEAHWVWSALIMTQWKSTEGICCHGCGTKSRIYAALSSTVLGWWGFPWGMLVTPVQVGRNIIGIISSSETEPSPRLLRHVRLNLAARDLAERQAADWEKAQVDLNDGIQEMRPELSS